MHLPPQFDQVFQLLPNPSLILLLDAPKFTIVAANKAYLETTFSLEEDLIGKGIFEAFPENPEDRVSNSVENLRNSFDFVIAKKDSGNIQSQKYDIPIRGTAEFKVKYANVQNIPIKDDNNNITHILHSVEDVTDKKNLEISFETERQRFIDLYLQAPSCMGILKGPNHVFELANPLYLKLIGEKDIIGKTVREVLPEVEGQGIFKILDAVYKTGESFSEKEMLIKFDKEGKGRTVEMYQDVFYRPHKDISGTIDGIFFFFIDVTEKVESRKKIEESEKRYRDLIENLPVATYSCDTEGRILVYNKAAAALWGREPEKGKDKWCDSLKIYNENGNPLPSDTCPMAIALKEGRILADQELIIEKANGEKANILPYPVPSLNSSGQVTGAVNVMIDITNRKRAEEKVRLQSDLLNIITQAVISTNAFGIINFWNKAATEIYGWTAEEALGENVISLISTKQKEGDTTEIMEKLSKGNSFDEFVVRHKDGHTFSVFAANSPIYGKQGTFEGTIEVSLDITGRKRAEEKLEKLNKELSDYKFALDESSIVAITDKKGIIKHVNDNFCEISQFSPEELIGQDHRIINSGYHSKEYIKDLWKTISKGEIWKGELKNKAKDGSTYWVDTIITPFLDELGKPYQYVVTRFDITKRKEAEENIKKQNEELVIQNKEKKNRAAELFVANKELAFQNGEKEKRADELILANHELEFQNREKENRAKELRFSNKELVKTNIELDRFVYSVSHDLRSPLTSILGLISFIEEDSREPDTLEQVKMIRSSINRLDGFIKNILSYSQNNRTGLDTQRIPLEKTINEIVDSVRNIKEASGISFQIAIDEQYPFYSDLYRFNTVLENLVGNAIKYHTKEIPGRFLKLTGLSNKEELKLSICDNGIGIDPEFHDKIFEMFYRLPGNTNGSGFGLYIVKETLEKIQGSIEIQSEKGVGTTFNIKLKNLEV